jgi:Flp pilus assembly protein TadD
LINERRFEEAIPAAERALELAPNEPRAEYNLGTALVNAGRIAEGRAHLARGRPGRSLEGKP